MILNHFLLALGVTSTHLRGLYGGTRPRAGAFISATNLESITGGRHPIEGKETMFPEDLDEYLAQEYQYTIQEPPHQFPTSGRSEESPAGPWTSSLKKKLEVPLEVGSLTFTGLSDGFLARGQRKSSRSSGSSYYTQLSATTTELSSNEDDETLEGLKPQIIVTQMTKKDSATSGESPHEIGDGSCENQVGYLEKAKFPRVELIRYLKTVKPCYVSSASLRRVVYLANWDGKVEFFDDELLMNLLIDKFINCGDWDSMEAFFSVRNALKKNTPEMMMAQFKNPRITAGYLKHMYLWNKEERISDSLKNLRSGNLHEIIRVAQEKARNKVLKSTFEHPAGFKPVMAQAIPLLVSCVEPNLFAYPKFFQQALKYLVNHQDPESLKHLVFEYEFNQDIHQFDSGDMIFGHFRRMREAKVIVSNSGLMHLLVCSNDDWHVDCPDFLIPRNLDPKTLESLVQHRIRKNNLSPGFKTFLSRNLKRICGFDYKGATASEYLEKNRFYTLKEAIS